MKGRRDNGGGGGAEVRTFSRSQEALCAKSTITGTGYVLEITKRIIPGTARKVTRAVPAAKCDGALSNRQKGLCANGANEF